MIPGNKVVKIKEYFPTDRCCEGYVFHKPKEGEEFWGIPYGWYEENSLPFIEARKGGVVVRTININSVDVIDFYAEDGR